MFVFLVSRNCCVALPYDATGLSAVCDCGFPGHTCTHLLFFTVSTVDSEIFARTLFSQNFAYAKFRENKTLAKWQNYSVFY